MKLLKHIELGKTPTNEAFRALYDFFVALSKKNGKRYYLGLFESPSRRTIPQNRYYFGVAIKMISDLTGHVKDDLHHYLCLKYLGETKKKIFDKVLIRRVETKTLPTDEFKEYTEKVRQWAYEKFGDKCDIPAPDGLPISVELQIFFEDQKSSRNELK